MDQAVDRSARRISRIAGPPSSVMRCGMMEPGRSVLVRFAYLNAGQATSSDGGGAVPAIAPMTEVLGLGACGLH
jgi:hypothetical protein